MSHEIQELLERLLRQFQWEGDTPHLIVTCSWIGDEEIVELPPRLEDTLQEIKELVEGD